MGGWVLFEGVVSELSATVTWKCWFSMVDHRAFGDVFGEWRIETLVLCICKLHVGPFGEGVVVVGEVAEGGGVRVVAVGRVVVVGGGRHKMCADRLRLLVHV